MAANGGTQQSLRRVIGTLKDSTKVGLVKLNSDNKGLNIAIIKATNHDEVLPKEKHIRTILGAVSVSRSASDVVCCIQGLAKRLRKTHNWTVALKTLIVIHRVLREVDPSFIQELINNSRGKALMWNLAYFKDDSIKTAWDYSSWVRAYALFLEERLECFRMVNYDIEKSCTKTKRLSTSDLLVQLPSLQQLLSRLLDCKRGAALRNNLIQYAIAIILSESSKLYGSITDGILKLADNYFKMGRQDASRTLEIYKKAENQADSLIEFVEMCRGLEFWQGQNIIIEKLSVSAMAAMEDYVKEAPQVSMLQDSNQAAVPIEAPKVDATPEADLLTQQHSNVKENSFQPVTTPGPASNDHSEATATQQITDLLGLEELIPQASESDGKNSLALAIAKSEYPSNPENNLNTASRTLSWELALVTAPSSNGVVVAESKVADGLDKSILDSLYDAAIAKGNQNGTNTVVQVAPNPFEVAPLDWDPFCASSSMATPSNVQMEDTIQLQHFTTPQQEKEQKQELRVTGQDATNPFGNPFLDHSLPSHPPQDTSTGLICTSV